jgi:hypothetical protein
VSATAECPEIPVKEESEGPTSTNETFLLRNSIHDGELQPLQSKLHNCPKHLVKFLAQALDLTHLDKLDCSMVFAHMTPSGRLAIKGLLEILQLSYKGKIKSTSKELLKIVFENGSERNKKFRLLSNSRIRNFFENHEPTNVIEAKNALR